MKLFKPIFIATALLICCTANVISVNSNEPVPSKEQIEFNKKWWEAVNKYNVSDRIEFKSDLSLHYIKALREYEAFLRKGN